MSKNTIYAQTQTKDNYLQDKKITAKYWKVYYYMLSVSKFNSNKVEDHRYIYKKDFNISQACRDLGIKSNQTFYNALKRLEAHKLVKVKDDNYFLYAQNWIDINKEVLSALIKYARQEEQDIDLLRTFLILKKLNKIAQNSDERSFTLRQLSVLLGHGDTTAEYYKKIRIYLALLSFWNMIELKQHKHYDSNLNTSYTIYHLQMVSENNLSPDFNINIEEEMLAPLPSEKLMDKLRFCYPEILE